MSAASSSSRVHNRVRRFGLALGINLALFACDAPPSATPDPSSRPENSAPASPVEVSLSSLFQQLERSSLEAAKLAAARQIASFKLPPPISDADLLCLKAALISGDARVRVTALGVAQRIGDDRARLRTELELCLLDAEPLVRFSAAQTLLLCDKTNNEALATLLNGLAELEKQEGTQAVRIRLSENVLRLSPLPLESKPVLILQLQQSSDSHRRLIVALIHRMKINDAKALREPLAQVLRESTSEPLVTELKQALARIDERD